MKREYPPGDFLSGFGGSYEAGCQALVLGGLEWLDEQLAQCIIRLSVISFTSAKLAGIVTCKN